MGRVHGDSLLDINTTNMFRSALLICSVAYATAKADASYGYGGYGGYGHLGTLDMAALSHMPTPLDPTSLMLSSMCPMVMLLPASTVLLTLVLSTLLRGPPTLMLSTDTEDTATWVTLDMAALSHMLTPQDPTSLMLSSMCPMVTLLPASTVLLMLVLFTLLRGLLTLTLSTDTEDTDTQDL